MWMEVKNNRPAVKTRNEALEVIGITEHYVRKMMKDYISAGHKPPMVIHYKQNGYDFELIIHNDN